MSGRTPVYIVCSPRSRVGKTLVARVLTEFFFVEGRTAAAFDLDEDEPKLLNCLPSCTTAGTLRTIRGQMALFDRLVLEDETPKIVDVGRREFHEFFTLAQKIDFFDEARRRGVEPVILFMIDPDETSALAFAGLQSRFSDAMLVPVQNEAVAKGHQMRGNFRSTRAAALPLRIPQLQSTLRTIVEEPNFSFANFRQAMPPGFPTELRNEMESWMKRVFLEFHELELRLLLERVRTSLKDQP
ncbi:MAG TPA: hypothetical protein VHA77_01010 [Xanthobacteraceae bacterium]|jgi:hypothetical protein|nr:hypothetical protein [Xanthobacteraceae bacterium]